VNKLLYTVLPVGQGTGTLVEVVDTDTEVPSTMVIIDLGSKSDHDTEGGLWSVQAVIGELNKMPNPTLDAVFLSHPDDDHYNLFFPLLNAFAAPADPPPVPPKKVLLVNNVWYGGNESRYAGLIERLRQFKPPAMPKNIHNLPIHHTDLDNLKFNKDGLEISVLMANTAWEKTYVNMETDDVLSDPKQSYLRNTRSLVLVISYGTNVERRFIATGDATAMTMAACIDPMFAYEASGRSLGPVASISAPHHGSAATTYDVLGAAPEDYYPTPDDTAYDLIHTFVNYLKPESVTVSAGEKKLYKHPSPQVIADFAQFTEDAKKSSDKTPPLIWEEDIIAPDHFYVAYFRADELKVIQDPEAMDTGDNKTTWPEWEGWWSARTAKAVYSTEYFVRSGLPDTTNIPRAFPPSAQFLPPAGPYGDLWWYTGWEYTVSQDGNKISLSAEWGNPPKDDDAKAELASKLPPAALAQPVPVLGPVVLPGTARPPAGAPARLPRRGRRQARPLL
jgi:beta-lactamase superfamily II metal-dependent hydrolase